MGPTMMRSDDCDEYVSGNEEMKNIMWCMFVGIAMIYENLPYHDLVSVICGMMIGAIIGILFFIYVKPLIAWYLGYAVTFVGDSCSHDSLHAVPDLVA